MKIAVDARELAGKPTGVGRYLVELLREWQVSARAAAHEFTLYAHREVPLPWHGRGTVRVLPGDGGTTWEQWTLPRALSTDRPDVLFAPAYSAPLTAPCPVVQTIHDVSFAAHPEWFSFREGARRRFVTRWSARRARVVLTDSEFSRDEIVRHLGIPRDRIKVILLGMTPRPPAVTAQPREPLILFVGSIFHRRNPQALLAAFAGDVARRVPDSRLEIVGDNRTVPPIPFEQWLDAAPPGVRARISVRSYVDAATLDDLYSRASVFAFPSEYEGFGLTPLEALAAGVPPVVLDTPIAREIYGEAARYVPRTQPLERPLADALVEMLTDASARARVLAHRETVISRYRWDLTAAATLAAIQEAALG